VSFRVVDATNDFYDEFSVLHAVIPLEEYERLRHCQQDHVERQAFGQVAQGLSELEPDIQFVAVDLALERPVHPAVQSGLGLKQSDISKLVYKYIGVSGGYLADFSYRSHHEFSVDPTEKAEIYEQSTSRSTRELSTIIAKEYGFTKHDIDRRQQVLLEYCRQR
jgi:hypothetical protein